MLPQIGKHRYPLLLGAVSVLILGFGLAFKPGSQKGDGKRASNASATRAELESLRRLVTRNTARNLGLQFSGVAESAAEFLLPMAGARGTAVVVRPSTLLLPKKADELPHAITFIAPDGTTVRATPRPWVPGLPFVTASVAEFIVPQAAKGHPAPGAWLIAVAPRSGGSPAFFPGVYFGTAEVECGPFVAQKLVTNIPQVADLAGAGVFDLDLHLVGVVTQCAREMAVVPVDAVQRALAAASGATMLSLYGMRLSEPNAAWRGAGAEVTGAFVSDVWMNWPADDAGLKPGDVIVSVDGQQTPTADQARLALVPGGSPHDLRVWRGRRQLRLTVEQAGGTTSEGAAEPISIEDPDAGVRVTRVSPESGAYRAGIRDGDRIIEINRVRANADTVMRTLDRVRMDKPVPVLLQRGALLRAVTVTP